MCGRYVSASPPEELVRYFAATPPATLLEENYNVAPTDKVYAVRARNGQRSIDTLRWGLVPFWAAEAKIGSKMINARSETAPDKPAFRRSFQVKRCLLPADGFYEWQRQAPEPSATPPGSKPRKQPFFIHRSDGEPLVMAGLWDRWYPKGANDDRAGEGDHVPDGADAFIEAPIETCTILTTSANQSMAPIHDRMPVLLPPSAWDEWLDPGSDHNALRRLLIPAPDDLLVFRPVSTMVNNVRNKGRDLILAEPPE